MRKILMSTILSFLAILMVVLPVSAGGPVFPDVIPLPDGFRPEGIAVGPGSTFYTGSLADGAIYRGNLRTGQGKVFIPGEPGMASVGMAYDQRSKYLFVAGGATGLARVFDTRKGTLVASFQLTEPGNFINDVKITRWGAVFTNSNQPVLHVLPLGPRGRLPKADRVVDVPLSGDWEQVEGFNANGIEAPHSGRYLIVVNSTVGMLYRVNPKTGAATAIDLGGESMTMGDGLLLVGQTLYVVRNRANEIVVIKMKRDLSSGRVVDRITQDNFDVPTTLAKFGHSLYAPNAKFGTVEDPDTAPYEIVRIPLIRHR